MAPGHECVCVTEGEDSIARSIIINSYSHHRVIANEYIVYNEKKKADEFGLQVMSKCSDE